MKRLPMKTHGQTRNTLSRLIRAYHRNEIEDSKFRGIVHALNVLLGYWKLEKEMDIETRIEALEDLVRSM